MTEPQPPSVCSCESCVGLRQRVADLELRLESERERRVAAQREADRLTEAVLRDIGTGLPNRAAYLGALDQSLVDVTGHLEDPGSAHVAVLVVQVEDFATLGHRSGLAPERVLSALAARFHVLGDAAGMVARVGVDELAVVAQLADSPDHLSRLADRVEEALTRPLDIQGHEVAVRCRAALQLATVPKEADQVLREAEGALHAASSSGEHAGAVLFSSERGRHVVGAEFEAEMRRALREEHIEAWFQQLVDLSTGRVVGAEALARWNHPEHGFIPPSRFVEQAEDAHVVDLLTDHMLVRACRWAAQHPEIDGPVHVNLSADDLADVRLVGRVRSALADAKLTPRRLSLEITERVFVTESPIGFRNLKALRDLGVGLAIDDFGVLYASFAYLRRFPADVIKIDRSFVVDVETDSRDREVLRGIVTMARALGMRTVAEGVETDGQARILADLGVDMAQGWLFGQARPAKDWDVAGPPATRPIGRKV